MCATKELTANQIAADILDKCDNVIKYGIADLGTHFPNYTKISEENGVYVNCVMYIQIRKYDGGWNLRMYGHRNLLEAVKSLNDQGVIDADEIRGITDKNRCNKCGGSGYISGYDHVFGGVCFKCGGTGTK